MLSLVIKVQQEHLQYLLLFLRPMIQVSFFPPISLISVLNHQYNVKIFIRGGERDTSQKDS